MVTASSPSDEVPSKPFPFCNSKKFFLNSNSDDQDRILKKKPKSKSKTKSNKRRRHRRRHSSLSFSPYSSDSDSDHYYSRKRDKPKKKRKKKEKELAKSDKRKSQKKKKKKRHDTPSASSSSPVRRLKSRKRRRSPSPSPGCSTCSSRGRSPSRQREEERLPKSPDVTGERWEERDKIIEAYDDYQSSRNDERDADAAGNDEPGKTRLASVVQSTNGDKVVMVEEEERSIGVGNARFASVVGSANYDMAVEEEEEEIAGSGGNAGNDDVDLELILRQKALENFRKFRGGLSANKEFDKPAVDGRIGSSDEGGSIPNQPIKVHGYSDIKLLEQSQSGLSVNKGSIGNRVAASSIDVETTTNQVKKVQGSTNRMVLSEQTTGATVAQDKKLVAEPSSGKVHRSEVRVGDKKEAVKPAKEGNFRNPNSTETSKPTVSRTFSKPIKGGSMQNEEKVEESSNRLLSEQPMLAKVAKDKTLVTETGGDKAHTGLASIGDGTIPPVSCPIKDDENCKSNEPMVNSATGSEFEQKTFCRVRDGETVQVKYKVYIPKKTPALARRKLQR